MRDDECFVTTKKVYKDRSPDLVGSFGAKAVKVMGPIEALCHVTQCGAQMDAISFVCFDIAVQSMLEKSSEVVA